MNFIGIDPGASGGLAALIVPSGGGKPILPSARGNRLLSLQERVVFNRMPKTHRRILDWLEAIPRPATALLELIPTAIFGTGKSSMSKLYGSYQALEMALVAAGLPYLQERPVVWQRALGIPKVKGERSGDRKQRLKREAARCFPELKVTLFTADALLLALRCRELYQKGGPR